MKTKTSKSIKAFGAAVALTAAVALPGIVRAADHGDAPVASNDQPCDIGDAYFFLDPNDNSQAVLIGTFRGFIVPGEAVNFAFFDPNVRYRFAIENSGNAEADKIIDVTFEKRTSTTTPQMAKIKFPGVGTFQAPTTIPTLAATPTPQTVTDLGATGIKFFAGEVDDPFFFDIPAFSRVVSSILAGAPDTSHFQRARDSFAGYNILSIALRVPVSLLKAPGASASTSLGLSFAAQRRLVETPALNGEKVASGEFRNIDRTGIPAVNVALIPFAKKNRYNAATTKDDKNLKFAPDIKATVDALVLGLGRSQNDADDVLATLASLAVANRGDVLRLETNTAIAPNNGSGGGTGANGFPNGRRLRDDIIDIILGIIAGGPVGDNVNASDVAPGDTFPFLAPPQQPRQPDADPVLNVDDNTRN
jgi:hypothetical protein